MEKGIEGPDFSRYTIISENDLRVNWYLCVRFLCNYQYLNVDRGIGKPKHVAMNRC